MDCTQSVSGFMYGRDSWFPSFYLEQAQFYNNCNNTFLESTTLKFCRECFFWHTSPLFLSYTHTLPFCPCLRAFIFFKKKHAHYCNVCLFVYVIIKYVDYSFLLWLLLLLWLFYVVIHKIIMLLLF